MTPTRIALVVCLLLAFRDAAAQPADRTHAAGGSEITPAGIRAFIDALVPDQLQHRRIAGAAVVVVKDGAVILREGYGYADVAARRPMTANTPVRIASITKTVTALAAMQLVDAGTLDLDRDVREYLDFALPAGASVTVRTLLSHQTGFEDRHGGIVSWSGERVPLGPYLARHVPPRLPRRENLVAYSNYNAALVACVIERLSGQQFEQYLARHVFAPLGMTRTTAAQVLPEPLRTDVSSGYVRSDLPPTPVSMAGTTIYEVGSAGITASASDMALLLRALLNSDSGLVSKASLATMMAGQTSVPYGFVGLGVYSPLGQGGNAFVGHDGDTGSFHSALALFPERGFGLFASYNSDGAPDSMTAVDELLQRITERYFSGVRLQASPVDAAAVTGTYEMARHVDSTFFKLHGLVSQVAVGSDDTGLTIRPAFLPVGNVLEEVEPGLLRWSGRDVTFAGSGPSAVMQIGAPHSQWHPVPWWARAGVVVPALLISLPLATIVVAAWPAASLRRRKDGAASRSPSINQTTRLALLLHLAAIGGTMWLVFWGWPLVASSSPVVAPLVLAIYAAAWTAVLLTPFVFVRAILLCRRGVGFWRGTREVLLAVLVVALTWFSWYWRIAGTTLEF